MNPQEIDEISSSAQTVSWASLVYSALGDQGTGLHFSGESVKHTLKQVWVALRKEIYDLFCTDSAKYAKERAALNTTLKPALVALAAFLTKDYGYPTAAASSLVGLGLVLPLRMVKDAWCTAAASEDTTEVDREALLTLIKDNAVKKV